MAVRRSRGQTEGAVLTVARTPLGAFLRAFMLEDHDETDRRRDAFDNAGGGDDEYFGMVDALFTVVVRRVFRPPVNPDGIRGVAERCRDRFGDKMSVHDLQMLIRYRLGADDDPA